MHLCDVQEVADEHYDRLSDDKVQQSASSKVNALVRFKWNEIDWGTEFTCFTCFTSLLASLVPKWPTLTRPRIQLCASRP